METAWIQVFVLTLSECLAPAGKTICQEQELQLQFVTQTDCELAREQLVYLLDRADDVIVNRQNTRCTASARQQAIFASEEGVVDASVNPRLFAAVLLRDFSGILVTRN